MTDLEDRGFGTWIQGILFNDLGWFLFFPSSLSTFFSTWTILPQSWAGTFVFPFRLRGLHPLFCCSWHSFSATVQTCRNIRVRVVFGTAYIEIRNRDYVFWLRKFIHGRGARVFIIDAWRDRFWHQEWSDDQPNYRAVHWFLILSDAAGRRGFYNSGIVVELSVVGTMHFGSTWWSGLLDLNLFSERRCCINLVVISSSFPFT